MGASLPSRSRRISTNYGYRVWATIFRPVTHSPVPPADSRTRFENAIKARAPLSRDDEVFGLYRKHVTPPGDESGNGGFERTRHARFWVPLKPTDLGVTVVVHDRALHHRWKRYVQKLAVRVTILVEEEDARREFDHLKFGIERKFQGARDFDEFHATRFPSCEGSLLRSERGLYRPNVIVVDALPPAVPEDEAIAVLGERERAA